MIEHSSRLDPRRWAAAVAAWFGERLDLEPLGAVLRRKTVPDHRHSWIYLLGGAAGFLFLLQVASGALLMLYYQPTDTAAHESVRRIVTHVPCGWFVRSVHAWGADLFIAVVGLHFLVKLFARAYRRPHEITWLTGMGLLFVALAFGFSGYLLPWTELSYYATLVGTQIGGTVPVVGDGIVQLLRGGTQVSGATITRFYAGHVMWLPLATGGVLLIHVALVQLQGMSLPGHMTPDAVRDERPFFSEFLLLDACVWLGLLGAVVTLAALLPMELGPQADPLKAAPQGIRPEWYFLFMFQILKHVPELVGVASVAAGAVFLTLIPLFDRSDARAGRRRWLTAALVAMIAAAAVLQSWAWLTPGPNSPAAVDAAGQRDVAQVSVTLVLFWSLLGFLVFYLRRLLHENARIRRLYRGEAARAR